MRFRLILYVKFTLFIIVFSCLSCRAILIEVLVKDKSAIKKMKILEKGEKQIIYLPLVHIGSQEYYQEIKDFLMEKRKAGYTVYYEGVKHSSGLQKSEKVILDLKLRRLLGIHLSAFDIKENKSLPGYVNKKNYVYQSIKVLGIDSINDFNADLSRQELVELYEEENGIILLDSCDFRTPLFEKYECSDGDAYYKVIFTYREDALIKKLLNSKHDKIVLLFGKSHWIKSIYPDLVHKNGFILKHGKI